MICEIKTAVVERSVFVINKSHVPLLRVVNYVCTEEVVVAEDNGTVEGSGEDFQFLQFFLQVCQCERKSEKFALCFGSTVCFWDPFKPLGERAKDARWSISRDSVDLVPKGKFVCNKREIFQFGQLSWLQRNTRDVTVNKSVFKSTMQRRSQSIFL